MIKTIISAVLRIFFYNLTGNAAITNDAISKEIEERLRMILMLEDPLIIIDMRTNNGFKEAKFDYFWNKLDAYFNEVILFIKFYYIY